MSSLEWVVFVAVQVAGFAIGFAHGRWFAVYLESRRRKKRNAVKLSAARGEVIPIRPPRGPGDDLGGAA